MPRNSLLSFPTWAAAQATIGVVRGVGFSPRGVLRAAVACLLLSCVATAQAEEPRRLELRPGDHVCIIGNTLAERMQYFGHFETLLHSRFPQHQLVVRNLGWSADELTLRPRSQGFEDHGHNLADHQADVIIACFGFNESFAGPAGLAKFESDLENFINETLAAQYNGESPPRLALVSPIAHEDLGNPHLPHGQANNENIKLYSDAMARAAQKHGLPFADLFTPTLDRTTRHEQPSLTINGIHLSDSGDKVVSGLLDEALFGPRPASNGTPDLGQLLAEVREKERQFFFDYRSVNGCYIYGGRKEPFGVVNFPAEFAKLRKMIANRDQRIWAVAQGQSVPETIDDGNTGDFTPIETNFTGIVSVTSPEDAIKQFTLPEGYEINLFASEVEFPDLQKPVQLTFDAQGRLWVCTMPSYPQYLPGVPVNDKVLIFEDADGDGRADKQTVFADGLHLPTGLEIGDKGVYVAQQPNLMHLRDTDGDDRADTRELVLHGFDSGDSHHSISAFTWDPAGALYFQEGTFHRTQVETPYGPVRLADAGVFRYEPRSGRFDVFVSYGFANPWGHYFDRWGQNFVADASGGANYYGTAFSGQVDYPHKHGGMEQFLVKQWRPTSGCELVSSRNFPDDVQGDYLLNNCIGFHGVLQYRMREDGSGFAADPVAPLLQSTDQNFRPVDLEFGPDGALYIIDWFNPLVGHMQHSLRDPNRDKTHGRIWRIVYKGRPLVTPAQIAGQPVPALLDLLKTYEDRTRYRTRIELRDRDTAEVMAELDKWIAGLDPNDADYEHHMLEALWLHGQHDVVDIDLLQRTLRSPDYRARAAATRVLCYWRDRVPEALPLLQVQAGDEHPRVRLEAVRAASFFHDPAALDVALESLGHPTDYYLDYTLKETMSTLERRGLAGGE
jgi:glucose/arabinose dehydrogenase